MAKTSFALADVDIGESTYLKDEEVDDDSAPVEEDEDGPIEYDIEAPNMMASLMASKAGKKAVKAIGDKVYAEVEDAWDAQEEYRDRAAANWDIFSGKLGTKNFPFEGCANVHVPSFMEDGSRLAMRMYVELFGDFSDVFSYSPVGPDDQEAAEIASRFSNFQLREEITDFPAQMERACLFFIMPGDATCHSFYDPKRRRNRHEILTVDDFIVPYVHVTTEIDYSDCPWVAKWLRLYKHQLQGKRSEWFDVDTVINNRKPSHDDEPDSQPMAESQKDLTGTNAGDDQRAPYKLLHYEGWIELPNEADERFCKVVMDWATKRVLQIQLLEEDDWQDRARFDRQTEELETFRAQFAQFEADTAMRSTPDPMTGQLPPPPMDPMTGMEMPPPTPPVPPEWAEDPSALLDPSYELEPVRRVPIHMFTHGKGIEGPAGPHGTGVGQILADLNKAQNIVACQAIDAATLANCATYLVAGGVGGKEPLSIKPGKMNPVPGVSSKDLDKMIHRVDVPGANPQMFNLLSLFRGWSEGASTAPSVLSGEAGKSGETYRGIQTRIEQATKQVSFITGKVARFVANIAKNNGRLNAQFLPDERLVYVNDHKAQALGELKVRRGMFDRDYRVQISADLRFSSQAARVQEANDMLAMVTQTQQIAGNMPLVQAVVAEVFKAHGKDLLIRYLGEPLPPPPLPSGFPVPPPPPGPTGQEPAAGDQAQPVQPPSPPTGPNPPSPGEGVPM